MPDESESRSQWHHAAARASFTPYEPVGSSERWAGGFGSDGDHLEVIALVDGVEMSVDTSRPERSLPHDVRLRNSIAGLLWRHTLAAGGDLQLPYSVRVIADDRPVMVDGARHTAHGMRVDGDPRWVGSLRLDDVALTITTTSSEVPPLQPCADSSSLSDTPALGR